MSDKIGRRASRPRQAHEQRTSFWRTWEVEHAQGLGITSMYPANTGVVGHGSEVREDVVWWKGEGKTYSGVPAHILLWVMSYWDNIPPKRRKNELETLGACHEGQQERMPLQANKQNSFLCLVMGSDIASTGKWWWLDS